MPAPTDGEPDEQLVAALQPAKIGAAEDALPVPKRRLAKLQQCGTHVQILLRAGNGVGVPAIYN